MTTFSIGAVLSVTTGRTLAPVDEIHALLDYLTGDALMTHQLGRAITECQPDVRRQHPDLAAVEVPEFAGEEHVHRWVSEQSSRFGASRDVRPVPPGVHVFRDPLAELAEMLHGGER